MRIFVSYRRADAAPWAGRLQDSLAARLGADAIFQDVVAVLPGQDFTEAIAAALAGCDAALVVIGPQWLRVTDADGNRRLDQPGDHVRTEIEAALDSAARVIPVLVGGAGLPAEDDLPVSLRPLARRQSVELRDATWRRDVDALVDGIATERATGRRSRRRIAAGAAIAAAVIVVVAVAAVLRLRDDDAGTSTGPTPCPTPDEDSGWEAVSISPPSPTPHLEGPDGAWSISPVDAHQRSESDRRRVVLTLRATNEDTASHYDVEGFYELVVDGVQYEHVCFDVIEGDQPLDPDSTHVALVGFSVPESVATGELALDVDLGDGADRLALRADGS